MSNVTAAAAAEAGAKALLSANQGLSFGPFILSTVVFNMHLFAYGFGSYAQFETTNWLGWPPFMDCVIGIAVQAVYVDRAFRLNGRNWFILIIAGALMLVSFAGGTGTVISFIHLQSESQAGVTLRDEQKIYVFVELWLAATMTIDVLIVACVGYGLWKSKTGWSHTDALVQKLIVSLAFLITYVIDPPSTVDFFLTTILSKVYAVGLYALLNSRHNLRRMGGTSSGAAWYQKSNTFPMSGARPHQTTINVTQETYVESQPPLGDKLSGINRAKNSDLDIERLPEALGDQVNLDYTINSSSAQLTEPDSHYIGA
ncbi:MAG: hypothetical protein TREMPRED_001319 [Tremellales sp. Tagirdzhanova-0007]|nr:MAG: hypothetical protein TREMPRED_001319 [Tremellales sp. Tagirdzhanova-0007]